MRKIIVTTAAALLLTGAVTVPAAAAPAHRHAPSCALLAVAAGRAGPGHAGQVIVVICGLNAGHAAFRCAIERGRLGDPSERWACTRVSG